MAVKLFLCYRIINTNVSLIKQIEKDLKIQVLKMPSELGYSQTIWDGSLVCKYISDTYFLTIAVRIA